MPKWCWNWPHCACGIKQAMELKVAGQKLLIFRNDVGDIKRVPVSELETFSIVEGIDETQMSAGCPRAKEEADGAS